MIIILIREGRGPVLPPPEGDIDGDDIISVVCCYYFLALLCTI